MQKFSHLKFQFPTFSFRAKLIHSKAPKTIETILKNLPVKSHLEKWGEEVYFSVDFDAEEENATTDVSVGDIAFWPPGSAIAVFFGPTPLSKGSKPVPASSCNVFARVENFREVLPKLTALKGFESVVVSKTK